MTQALAGFNEHGIVLATDSRATRFDAAGQPEIFNVNKLFALNRRSAILSGGAGVSVLPVHSPCAGRSPAIPAPWNWRKWWSSRFPSFPRVTSATWRNMARRPKVFAASTSSWPATFPTAPRPTSHMVLLGSEENELPLRRIQIGNVVVMPRNLGMEMRLFKALNQGADLEEVLHLSKDFLEKMAAVKEEVGPPFHYATITSRGYQSIIL